MFVNFCQNGVLSPIFSQVSASPTPSAFPLLKVPITRTSTSIEINNLPRYPKLSIGIELAKAMRWKVMGTLDNGQPGYVLGPNLRKEFPTNIVPAAVDLVKPTTNGDEFCYKIDPDVLHLSCFINWVFMDLDASFEKAFGSNQRPMYLYTGSSRSMIVGNQVTGLLREVPYSLEKRHLETEIFFGRVLLS